MNWQSWREYFFPTGEKQDPEFREEISRLAVIGLRAIALICLGAPLFWLAARLLLVTDPLHAWEIFENLAILGVGLVATPLSFLARVRPLARLLGCLAGYLVSVITIIGSLGISRYVPGVEHRIPGEVTLVMLVGVTALPLRPAQTLAMGLSMSANYFAILLLAPEFNWNAPGDPMHLAVILMVAIICASLTAVIYSQRSSAYRARQQALRSLEELRSAQARLLLSESAASQGRLAAALSHELNSPLGALKSSLETLLLIFRKGQEQPQETPRLGEIVEGVERSARESSRRLSEIVDRMERVTQLSRVEPQAANLNELLKDTVVLLQSELEQKAAVSLDLQPLPLLNCRPQQLSAVFSKLLRNAAEAMDRKGNIWISSHQHDGEIIIEVRDDGRGIPVERLPNLFEPAFAVRGRRVGTSNWGFFISRSIIVEHGGQIEIESSEGKGTTVRVMLPAGPGLRR